MCALASFYLRMPWDRAVHSHQRYYASGYTKEKRREVSMTVTNAIGHRFDLAKPSSCELMFDMTNAYCSQCSPSFGNAMKLMK